uniref:Uncharacterized protein n=1 Tax=Araucaria cunninghamii TaxID=56994 RepID=A0A0D6QR21_ARACU
MAVISLAPLASETFLQNSEKRHSFRKSAGGLRFFSDALRRRDFPVRPTNINMNTRMASISTEDVKRREANHHPNLWDDAFIQSLGKPYEAPSNVKRAEKLITEIKGMFTEIATPDIRLPAHDFFERLSLIDNVERLGIDRHFRREIKAALDYVYRHWNGKAIGCGTHSLCTDPNTTALGLRILRLHRYSVSADVLEHFKGMDGQFLSFTNDIQKEIKCFLNLYRASLIAFPGEKVLDEAKAFTTTYLKEALKKIERSSLSREIELALEYDWHATLARLDARNYIDIYREDDSWGENIINKMPNMSNKKLLELAILDFNRIQALQEQELQAISRWVSESGLYKLSFARHRHVEYYFLAAGICGESEYSSFRLTLAKVSSLTTYLDDIYDTYGTVEELRLFTDAIKRWDPSATDYLPEYMKIVFMALYDASNEMARWAEKTQGRDTLDYARKVWEAHLDSCMQEAEWIAAGLIPTFEEYLEKATVSSGIRVGTLQPILTLDGSLPDNILPEVDYPSRFHELLCLCFRLRNDTISFKTEAARGEIASAIGCYMRDHPGSTEADALNSVTALMRERFKELDWEYLKPDNVPAISKDYAYAITRGFHLFYKERDGFRISAQDIKNHVTKLLIQPVKM